MTLLHEFYDDRLIGLYTTEELIEVIRNVILKRKSQKKAGKFDWKSTKIFCLVKHVQEVLRFVPGS